MSVPDNNTSQFFNAASDQCPGLEIALESAIAQNNLNPNPNFNAYDTCINLCQSGCPPGVDCFYICNELQFGVPTLSPIPTAAPGGTQYPITTPYLTASEQQILD